MTPLFTTEQFETATNANLLPCKCNYCDNTFYVTKSIINRSLNKSIPYKIKFCSKKCSSKSRIKPLVKSKKKIFGKENVNCKTCNKTFLKKNSEILRHPNHFCSRSCSAIYNNTHKTTGTRRSKLEIYLENKLTQIYPNIDIHFNRKDTINSELDIYIPSLKLAFELNGIFHYEPIFGDKKLDQIQNNDKRKFQACLEKGIEFCIIDTSSFINFKEQKAEKYLNIILTVIDSNLSTK